MTSKWQPSPTTFDPVALGADVWGFKRTATLPGGYQPVAPEQTAYPVIRSHGLVAQPLRELFVLWETTETLHHPAADRGVRSTTLVDESARVASLERALSAIEQERRIQQSAALTSTGPAILAYVASDPEGVDLETLYAQFEAPRDWMSLARLMSAGYIDDDGLRVYATGLGEETARELMTIAQVLRDAS